MKFEDDTENMSIDKKINDFNDNASYYELFNYDIWITIIAFIIVFFIASYYIIKSSIRSYKATWENNKCNPLMMPFASIINPELANGDDYGYTLDNFNDCLNALNAELATDMTKPINQIKENLDGFYRNLYNVAETTMHHLGALFTLIMEFFAIFITKLKMLIFNSQLVFITINDFFAKLVSILTVIYYTIILLVGAYRLIFVVALLGFLLTIVVPASAIVTIQTILLVNHVVRLALFAPALPWSLGFFLSTIILLIINIVTFIIALVFFIIIMIIYMALRGFVGEIQINDGNYTG
jgi:hypothetical protein